MSEWATEGDVISLLGLTWEKVDHCPSCHGEMMDGYPTHEIELPDGRTAEVCCEVEKLWRESASKKEDAGT